MVGVPNVAPDVEPLRKNPVFLYYQDNFKKPNPEVQKSLVKWYGETRAAKALYAEAFEICEYGTQPSEAEIRNLFPMLK